MDPIELLVVLLVIWAVVVPLVAIISTQRTARESRKLGDQQRALEAELAQLKSAVATGAVSRAGVDRPLAEAATPTEIEIVAASEVQVVAPRQPPLPSVGTAEPLDDAWAAASGLPPMLGDLSTKATAAEPIIGAGEGAGESVELRPAQPRPPTDEVVRPVTLEERLGARLPVWLGAIAILLAGVFLVAFAVQRGWFSPRLRVYTATALAAGLIVSGCVLRRSFAMIAQGLASAGVGIAYAVLLAVCTIFHGEFPAITLTPALAILVGITALAVGLSLWLGPMVAVVGLIGGFATPAILQVNADFTTPLFLCLVAQQFGASLAGRRHRQGWFSMAALIAVELYVGAWVVFCWDPLVAPILGGTVLASLICFLLGAPLELTPADKIKAKGVDDWQMLETSSRLGESCDGEMTVKGVDDWQMLATLPALLLGAVLMAYSDLNWINLAMNLAMLAGVMIYARLCEERFPLAAFAAAFSIGGLLARLVVAGPRVPDPTVLHPRAIAATWALAIVLGLGGMIASRGSLLARGWAWLAAASLLFLGLAGHIGMAEMNFRGAWLGAGIGIPMIAALATGIVRAARYESADGDGVTLTALAAFALSTLEAVALGIRIGDLSHYWLSVAGGVLLMWIAAIAYAWKLREANNLLIGLAIVLVASLLNPVAANETLLPRLWWNQATLGFGSGIVGLVLAARWLQRSAGSGDAAAALDRSLAQAFDATAAVAGALLLCLLTRHGFSRFSPVTARLVWLEVSTDLVMIGFVGLILMAVARSAQSRWMASWSAAFLLLSLLATLFVSALAIGPLVVRMAIAPTPIANELTFAVGVPVALAVAALMYGGSLIDRQLLRLTVGCLTATVGVLILLHVRHSFWLGEPTMVIRDASSFRLCEVPTYAVILGLCAGGAELAARRWRSPPLRSAGFGMAACGALAVIAVVCWLNPLRVGFDVGSTRIFNKLLYVFGGPCVVALTLGALYRRVSAEGTGAAAWAGLVLLWLLVTAQVRQYFAGPILPFGPIQQPEWYAYSAAWILLAVALLIAGVSARSTSLRWASLVLMLTAVGKVFLFDTGGLGDLWRVASYFGLGVSLMIVAFVYQRFVFRTARGTAGRLD